MFQEFQIVSSTDNLNEYFNCQQKMEITSSKKKLDSLIIVKLKENYGNNQAAF